MKKLTLAVLASISAFVAAPAQAAIVSCTAEPGGAVLNACVVDATTGQNSVFFQVSPTPTTLDPLNPLTGAFSTFFDFAFVGAGTVDSSLVTVAFNSVAGLQIDQVLFGSTPFTLMSTMGGAQSFVLMPSQQVATGTTRLTINGTVLQPGAQFSGNLTVGPPVPEPSVWAMMLVGFGAVGYSMRRRPRYRLAQAV